MRNNYLQMCDYSSRFRILKGGKISLVISGFITTITMLHAAPSGGVVTAGNALINQSGSVTNITQTTNKASINWQNFSIGTSETVNFNQPNVSSVTLNRVVGNERSIIDGALNANGQVFILNSNGVLFNNNASINTAGLIATTLSLSDTDFMNGNYNFKGDSTASVINQGTITISDKGYAALFGKDVINEGIIKATLGKVHLSGASEVTLNLNGNSLVNLKIDKGVVNALVENKGAVYADGGEVYLTTNAVNELLKGVVNNTGIVEANSLEDITGKIELFAHGGEVQVGGTLKAEGGFIETSGKEFSVAEGTTIKAKEWLIDPVNVTIDAALASTLEGQLSSGDATVTTTGAGADEGNINVNSAITWTTAQKLTLNADNNIYINADISSSHANGSVSLYYGQASLNGGSSDFYLQNGAKINLAAGDNFVTQRGSDVINVLVYKVITSLGTEGVYETGLDLQGMDKTVFDAMYYVLGADIDASATALWNGGEGFKPIGVWGSGLYTTFNGLGHTISGLTINRPTTDHVGLFGYTTGATIRDVHLADVSITGHANVGGLAGSAMNDGLFENVSVSGSVTGVNSWVGGVVGSNEFSINNSHSSATVQGSGQVGGLVGDHYRTTSIINSYATGNVIGTGNGSSIGGLVGEFEGDGGPGIGIGGIVNSYATGTVQGSSTVGGLVGELEDATITLSYATGNVSSSTDDWIGGLVGYSLNSTITTSYATGNVSGRNLIGGLVGNLEDSTLTFSYASGSVTATGVDIGGLVGYMTGSSIVNTYAMGSVSGTEAVGGLVGYNSGDSIAYSYASGAVTASVQNAGGLVGVNDFSNITNSYWDIDTTGQASGIGHSYGGTLGATGIYSSTPTVNAYTQTTYAALDFTNAWFMVDGYTRPFLRMEHTTHISNDHQLQLMAMDLSADYTLVKDIAYGGAMWSSAGFVPIGSQASIFSGSFDGLEHTITGLTIHRPTTDYVGLFGDSNAAFIKNVGLINVTIEGQNFTGSLVGENYYGEITNAYATGDVAGVDRVGGLIGSNVGDILNSYAEVDVTATGLLVGGLVGETYSDISHSYATGDVISTANAVGGLVGMNYDGADILYSYATGDVSGSHQAGGLVGYFRNATMTDSYATGNVVSTGAGFEVGGLIGYADTSTISTVYAQGDVHGNNQVGGLIGSAEHVALSNSYALGNVIADLDRAGGLVGFSNDVSSITDSYAQGHVNTGSGDYAGGLVGLNYSDITRSYATGDVSGGDDYTGGLIGKNEDGIISYSYATGDVTSDTYSIGGLVGWNKNALIEYSYATGTVTANDEYAGGLVGQTSGSTIRNSYATGNVISDSQSVGGLVGDIYTTDIENSYATGNVTGDVRIGGLVGYYNASSTIDNSYALGAVSGNGFLGGLVGTVGDSPATASFYNKTLTAGMSDESAYGKTTTEMQTLNTFSDAGWDIVEDSTLFSLYPVLTMSGSSPIWKIKNALSSDGGDSTPTPTPDVAHIENGLATQPPVLTNLIPSQTPVYTPTMQHNVFMGEKGNPSMLLFNDVFMQLIHGGLHLPEGVEQEFFMVKR